jgi:hypothetical protein
MPRQCSPRQRAKTGRLREAPGADHGRQDKSAASGRAHLIGWVGDFRHLANLTGWRSRQKHQQSQCAERHLHNQGRRAQP